MADFTSLNLCAHPEPDGAPVEFALPMTVPFPIQLVVPEDWVLDYPLDTGQGWVLVLQTGDYDKLVTRNWAVYAWKLYGGGDTQLTLENYLAGGSPEPGPTDFTVLLEVPENTHTALPLPQDDFTYGASNQRPRWVSTALDGLPASGSPEYPEKLYGVIDPVSGSTTVPIFNSEDPGEPPGEAFLVVEMTVTVVKMKPFIWDDDINGGMYCPFEFTIAATVKLSYTNSAPFEWVEFPWIVDEGVRMSFTAFDGTDASATTYWKQYGDLSPVYDMGLVTVIDEVAPDSWGTPSLGSIQGQWGTFNFTLACTQHYDAPLPLDD